MPPGGIPRKFKEGARAGDPVDGRMAEAAEEAGLVMRRAAVTPNTRLSFEASEFAKGKGLFEEFHKACYRALWEEGANLGDEAVLKRLAEQVGLDAFEMGSHLDTGRYRARVKAQYEEAIGMGVQGIPTFIIGRYYFSGAQPYEFFRQVAQRVQEEMATGEAGG